MELNEIKQRLERALRPVEKPPSIEEVLEQVSTRGVLRGPVDWVFPAWMLHVEYTTQKIAETFPLSEEEKRQLLHFRDAMKQLLLEAQRQTKAKLTTLYKAVAEDTYKAEGSRLYAPDGTWMEKTSLVPRIPIHGIGASVRFPDLLKLPRERLELLQLGWRASDESETDSRPEMNTSQPWQVFAWSATRHGELYVYVASANLTREGVSMSIRITSKSWKQKWSKAEAIDLVASGLRRGEWAPVLTMWLGDGQTERRKILQSNYKLVIAAKEPWRLGISIGTEKALVATGKEAFLKLRDSAGVYGELLDLLKAHKWIDIKLATDDVLRAAHKPNKKRGIDVLREVYRHNNSEISTEQFSQAGRRGRNAVVVAGVVMFLNLVSGRGGSLRAKRSIRCVGKALAIAGRFEEMGLRPNIVKAGLYYDVYIATEDLLRLAERDEAVRKAIALYLTEKAENGTPRQREIARKLLQRHPLFLSS